MIAVAALALTIGLITIIYQEQQTFADEADLHLQEIYNPQGAQQPR